MGPTSTPNKPHGSDVNHAAVGLEKILERMELTMKNGFDKIDDRLRNMEDRQAKMEERQAEMDTRLRQVQERVVPEDILTGNDKKFPMSKAEQAVYFNLEDGYCDGKGGPFSRSKIAIIGRNMGINTG